MMVESLLQALASGVRSVQSLPDDAEEMAFLRSLPEISALEKTDKLLYAIVRTMIEYCSEDSLESVDRSDIFLWSICNDVCDSLIDEMGARLRGEHVNGPARGPVGRTNTLQQIIRNTVDIPKPQAILDGWKDKRNLKRMEPFMPFTTEKPFDTEESLDLSLQGGVRQSIESPLPNSSLEVFSSVPHVYKAEIAAHEYRTWQLEEIPTPCDPPVVHGALPSTWICTADALETIVTTKLNCVKEIAVDLEAHSYRSFSGLTCLLQLSVRTNGRMENFLIDTLAIPPKQTHKALAALFANPDVVKVLHGAEHDVLWLQRDFSLYIVNMFDTGQACRALGLKAGYSFALKHFCGVATDKTHQLSDWRQRPLPENLQQYAITDTHYLLFIYDCARRALCESATSSVSAVLDASKRICLLTYLGEPFNSKGYKRLLRKANLSVSQEAVLAMLWDWRDGVARSMDESTTFICDDNTLKLISINSPRTLQKWNQLTESASDAIKQAGTMIIQSVTRIVNENRKKDDVGEDAEVVRAHSSAFFKPAAPNSDSTRRSPVLGTDALYREAGWLTPVGAYDDVAFSSANEADEHDLLMPASSCMAEQGSSDGLGTTSTLFCEPSELKKITDETNSLATNVLDKQKQSLSAVLDMTSRPMESSAESPSPSSRAVSSAVRDQPAQMLFDVPKSVREIFAISNRNRMNKKASSPTPDKVFIPTTAEEIEEVHKAEEILLQRTSSWTSVYFDNDDNAPKRHKAKSRGQGAEAPAEKASIRLDDDIKFMQDLGWIHGEKAAQDLMKDRYGSSRVQSVSGTGQVKNNNGIVSEGNQQAGQNPFFSVGSCPEGNAAFARSDTRRRQKHAKSKQEKSERKEGRSLANRKK